jgi:hypothetical protein
MTYRYGPASGYCLEWILHLPVPHVPGHRLHPHSARHHWWVEGQSYHSPGSLLSPSSPRWPVGLWDIGHCPHLQTQQRTLQFWDVPLLWPGLIEWLLINRFLSVNFIAAIHRRHHTCCAALRFGSCECWHLRHCSWSRYQGIEVSIVATRDQGVGCRTITQKWAEFVECR